MILVFVLVLEISTLNNEKFIIKLKKKFAKKDLRPEIARQDQSRMVISRTKCEKHCFSQKSTVADLLAAKNYFRKKIFRKFAFL